MILKKITLDNYGLYKGLVEFDLAPRVKYGKERPVILFGGKNGAGKTTLFDAFKIVLYGKSALGTRVPEAEYQQFLKSRIHRSAEDALHSQSASISLDFDYVSVGQNKEYKVTRAWEASGKSVKERLSITCNGERIKGVNHEYWQGFVESIIPERLSSLFFFDGEKIKDIADDTNGNVALAESINTLLGLDIMDQLHVDLDIYTARETKKHSDRKTQEEIAALEARQSEIKQEMLSVQHEIGQMSNVVADHKRDAYQLEQRLMREGQTFAQQRESLTLKKNEYRYAIDDIKQNIREECEGFYPFALCPHISKKLIQQLKNESISRKSTLLDSELEHLESELNKVLENKTAPDDVADEIKLILKQRRDAIQKNRVGNEYLKLSDLETHQFMSWITEAESDSVSRMKNLSASLSDAENKLHSVEDELHKAPSDIALQPIVDSLNETNNKIGKLEADRDHLESILKRLEREYADIAKQLQKFSDLLQSQQDVESRIALSKRIQAAIKDYSERLTQSKIDELKTTVADCFNRLSRKGDLIKEIDIDPKTFAVSLLDRYGNVLPKEELSAGEKQMYAVAMLWGLSITSKRNLPVVIDTPLGRLDSDHRRKLINNYFPEASEQVVILSTDTEIDQQWYKELSPAISHCFHLSYSADENKTEVSPKYFWRA